MVTLLAKVLEEYKSNGFILAELARRVKNYDRKHPFWPNYATDQMWEAWAIVMNPDLHV